MSAFDGLFKNKSESAIQVLLILGIAVTLNYLATGLIWRADLTADNRYTLSEASVEIAESIEDPITVTAYFSEDLPPQIAVAEDEFRNFLDEFRAYSGGNIEYEFVNPNESEETEREAQMARIQPVMLDVRERDQISQKRAYFGAAFKYEDRSEVVPVVRPGSALEYTLASTIKKLVVADKPKIGLLQGHGEPSRQAMVQVMQELNQMYEVSEVSGLDTAAVPAELEGLIVVAPTEALSTGELLAIDQYIMSGGKAIFALNRVDANPQQGTAKVLDTGLETLLAAYRLPINGDLVRDVQSSSIQVRQQQGPFSFVNQVRYPYIPLISNFGDHPISGGLETAAFQFVSSVDITMADSTQRVTPLARSSDKAATARGQFDLNPMREWTNADFTEANIPVAALIEGQFRSAFADADTLEVSLTRSAETALIVVGDGDFVINGEGQQQQGLPEDNINLMVNAVDWLADDTGLMQLRTKGVTNRPLENVEDATKATLKYLNLFLPILIALGYGFLRYQRRKSRRQKWLEEGV